MKSSDMPQTAYVVFTHAARVKWLSLLHPGFRHCFLALPGGDQHWVTIDPLIHHIDIRMHVVPTGLSFIDFFKTADMTILKITKRENLTGFTGPLSGTCVGILKRYLGIFAPFCLTPFSLYRRLLTDGADIIYAPPARPIQKSPFLSFLRSML